MAVKTPAQLGTTLNANITDPTNKQNTAVRVREIIQDIIDSMLNSTVASVAVTTNRVPKGTGTGINDGTWSFSTNDLLPVTGGSNLGGASNRIGSGFINTLNYATDLVFSEAGSEKGRFKTGGWFNIGVDSNAARLVVQGSGTTNATFTAIFENGAATPLKSLQIRDDGLVSVSTSAQNTYPVADKLNVYGIIRAFGDTTYDQAAIVLNTNGGGFGKGWSIESNLAASGNLWFKQAPNSAADPVATGVTMASFNSTGRFTLSTNIAPATTARLSLYETNYANTSQSQTLVGFTTDAEGINVGASMGLGGITNAAYTVFGSVGGRKENATAGSSLGYLQFSTYGSGGLAEGFRLNSSQYLIQKANNAAIADGDLSNSQMSWYIDESGNNIIVKVKYSGGTVKTATIALV
jgi:hypothetical protein